MRNTLATLASLFAFATPVVADGPVVVELYTSQGCSSCPPADAMLHDLAARPDVLALALHVDYWDYIGWADEFADPAYTQRQNRYAQVAGSNTIYTPQMIIGGRDHVIGTKPLEVMDFVQSNRAATTGTQIDVQVSGNRLQITGSAAQAFARGAIVQVVRFTPEETVDIRRGENQGRTISYVNIVTAWDVVGEWSGQNDLDMTVNLAGSGAVAVIVQEPGPGRILASALLR